MTCIDAGDRVIASLVLAGAGDAGAECARMARAIRGGDEAAQGRYLEVQVRADGRIVVSLACHAGRRSFLATLDPIQRGEPLDEAITERANTRKP